MKKDKKPFIEKIAKKIDKNIYSTHRLHFNLEKCGRKHFIHFMPINQKLINFALNFCSSDGNDLKARTDFI